MAVMIGCVMGILYPVKRGWDEVVYCKDSIRLSQYSISKTCVIQLYAAGLFIAAPFRAWTRSIK